MGAGVSADNISERVGNEFPGRIAGVQGFGVFVKLDETGADGLVPVSSIGAEYYRYDRDAQTLTGERSGIELSVGQRVLTRLAEAVPVTGGLMLELLEVDGKTLGGAGGGQRRGSGPVARKRGQARRKSEKTSKAVRRRRK